MVIYDGGNFEITLREVLVSVIILALMLTIGFFISEKITSRVDEKNQEYEQAIRIDSQDLFEYGMRTDAGNAFIYGELSAVDSVSLPELEGEYSFIRKIKERYTMHERTVTHTNGKNTYTTTEIYYTWDNVGYEDFSCTKILFAGHEFDYGVISFPTFYHLTTIRESYKIRYVYEVCNSSYTGTVYGRLQDNTLTGAQFMEGKTLDAAVEFMCTSQRAFVTMFWVLWIMITLTGIGSFYYLDNNWVED